MPQIRPVRYFDDLGRPADKASIYIYEVGKAWNDPGALLALTDAENGADLDNPFTTDENGFPVNTNGDRINPTVANTRWGLRGVNQNGVVIYDLPVQWSDTFGVGGADEIPVDATFNNFTDMIQQDLAAFDFIFCKSQGSSGWENTSAGPDKSFYAHATGGPIGAPSTGTPDLFYDSLGKEWAMSDISNIPYNETPTNVSDLVTLSGVPANSTDLGTFTGTTIPDNSDNKEALQALETRIELAADYITSQGNNGNGSFRIWNSGRVECWTQFASSTSSAVIPLPTTMPNTNYSILASYDDGNFGSRAPIITGTRTTTQFTVETGNAPPASMSFYVISL